MYALMTVRQAQERRVCRVCGRPIDYPSYPNGWWEHEQVSAVRHGEEVSTKNGAEYAHTACLENDVPFCAA